MAIKIVVEISDNDLEYYRNLLVQTSHQAAHVNDPDLIRKARKHLDKARLSGQSPGVQMRLDDLGDLPPVGIPV